MEILKNDHKLLRQKSKRVANIDDQLRNICAAMIETMLNNNGVGLAGNQVGLLKRIIIILHDNEPVVMINPVIVEHSDNILIDEEGCLSLPEEMIKKERYKTIKVKYRNLKGKPCVETYENLSARIIQHEIDHLDGILMVD